MIAIQLRIVTTGVKQWTDQTEGGQLWMFITAARALENIAGFEVEIKRNCFLSHFLKDAAM